MNIDVIADAIDITDEKVNGRIAVVIDVLRATSVMSAALENGAKYIVPVTNVEECFEFAQKLSLENPDLKVLKGGERNTYKIEGFDLDNSPLSYTKEVVEGAVVVMTTTNGTRTINRCAKASEIIVGSLLNASSVAKYLAAQGKDVAIVCSGRRNKYTMEDGYCAGFIASMVSKQVECTLSDLAWEQKYFYECFANNPIDALEHCEHYNNIKDRLAGDVQYCLRKNVFERIPKIQYNENSCCQEIR